MQEDDDLTARAAWLHFVGSLTQGEVAARLGISATRAHRAIARAQASGIVHITVKATAAACLELENQIATAFGLSLCQVAMDIPEPGPIPLKSLGATGGDWLNRVLAKDEHTTIGLSHGRTIAAMVESMAERGAKDKVFVSMLGGLTRSLAANPYDVIHRLAQKTGAEAYLMPAPLFADSPEDKAVLLKQSMLAEAFERAKSATLAIVGVGDLSNSKSIHARGGEQMETMLANGAVAEVLGHFLDADGVPVSTPFDGRTMAISLEDLRGKEVVAIAGGAGKVAAIRAVLRSGLLTGLIVDEATARALADGLVTTDTCAAE